MNDGVTELQICMPHIISDNISPDILFLDLSKFYLLHKSQSTIDQLDTDNQYRHYIVNEQHYFQTHLDRDIIFWEEYLKDVCVFAFPPENVVKHMKSQQFSYSTYAEIPEQGLNNLQRFCAKNQISIHDGLCAALTLALFNCCGNYNKKNQPIFMNIVKSTRNNPRYDDAIGCFLRLEPIKVNINKESTLATLSKQIHQSAIDTSLYQRCSSLLKLACLSTFCQERKVVRNYLVSMVILIYTTIFPTPSITRKILDLCSQRTTFDRNNNFIININVQNNFIIDAKMKKKSTLFGLKTKKINAPQYDLLTIDYFFDICFLRDENKNRPQLVISANLKPTFRELISKEIIRIIGSETLDLPLCTKTTSAITIESLVTDMP